MPEQIVYVSTEFYERRLLELAALVRKQNKRIARLGTAGLLLVLMGLCLQSQIDSLRKHDKNQENE